MGPLTLNCPFCCEEKFTSHESLKYHIMSIIDNIICPACNSRFETLIELAEHVGRKCKENDVPDDATKQIKIEQTSEENTSDPLEINNQNIDNGQEENEQSNEEEETIENIQAHIQNENEVMNNSILAQALLSNTEELAVEMRNEEEELLYNCQMCNIDFHSIEEHLEEYHKGEEVILETGETVEEDEEDNEKLMELNQIEEAEEEDSEKEHASTIEENECLDKEGRVYTRKVVKIDKFWEVREKNNQLKQPLIEKYVLEDGTIKKITEEEAVELVEKDKIIEVFQCEACCLQFPSSDNYFKHICNPSIAAIKYKCTHCSVMFFNYKSLNTHMKYHVKKDPTGEVRRTVTVGPFLCETCNTMFPSFKSLRLHKRMHDPVKSKEPEAPVNYSITGTINESKENIRTMFLCNICNKAYDKEYEEVHMKSHRNDNNYDCEVCNRKFYTQENLDMHMKAHNNGKRYICSYCKKGFISEESLDEHVKNQCQKRPYECQYCGRRFARPHEKVKHERIHTGEKPHVCQLCGKAFRVSYCLTLHMRTHSGTRPYQCPHCEKRFKSHSVYNHHLLTHSDVRAYKCPYCPKAFKTSVQLAGHKNSHIKPFSCTECNRPFASLYGVRAHMETHKRENNLKYECFICGASYARSFALKDHVKAQHNNGEVLGVTAEEEEMFIELETAVSTTQIQNEMEAEVS